MCQASSGCYQGLPSASPFKPLRGMRTAVLAPPRRAQLNRSHACISAGGSGVCLHPCRWVFGPLACPHATMPMGRGCVQHRVGTLAPAQPRRQQRRQPPFPAHGGTDYFLRGVRARIFCLTARRGGEKRKRVRRPVTESGPPPPRLHPTQLRGSNLGAYFFPDTARPPELSLRQRRRREGRFYCWCATRDDAHFAQTRAGSGRKLPAAGAKTRDQHAQTCYEAVWRWCAIGGGGVWGEEVNEGVGDLAAKRPKRGPVGVSPVGAWGETMQPVVYEQEPRRGARLQRPTRLARRSVRRGTG